MHEAIFVVGWSGLRLDARIYQKEEHEMEQRIPPPSSYFEYLGFSISYRMTPTHKWEVMAFAEGARRCAEENLIQPMHFVDATWQLGKVKQWLDTMMRPYAKPDPQEPIVQFMAQLSTEQKGELIELSRKVTHYAYIEKAQSKPIGRTLVELRSQCPYGAWLPFLHWLGISRNRAYDWMW